MKVELRKPALKRSLKARMTGQAKRAVKRALVPGHGKKGMGWIENPKKAAYNQIYHKTTFSIWGLLNVSVAVCKSELFF